MKRIVFDPKQCSLCGVCEIACSLSKGGRLDADRSRIRIETAGDEFPLRVAVCRHCEEPACVTACMRGIIAKDEETGQVFRKWEDCFRCAACTVYCPVGAIVEDPALHAFVSCDLCGGDPLCVQVCPNGALRFEDDGAASAWKRSLYAGQMFTGTLRTGAEVAPLPEVPELQWEKTAGILSEKTGFSITAEDLKTLCEARRRAAREEGL